MFDTFGSITPNIFNGNIIFNLEVEDFYSNSGSFFDVLGTNLQQNVAIYRLDQPDSSNTIGFKRYVFNYASQDAYTRYRTSTHIFTSDDYDKTIPLIIQYE